MKINGILFTIISILVLSCHGGSRPNTSTKVSKGEMSEPEELPEEVTAPEEVLTVEGLVGLWQYAYPYSSEEQNEDHYMLIEKGDGELLKGFYYGTSDDFDPAREGYSPGYYMCEMTNLAFLDGYLSFELDLYLIDMFDKPVSPGTKLQDDIQGEKWINGPIWAEKSYLGKYENGKFTFQIEEDYSRTYSKLK